MDVLEKSFGNRTIFHSDERSNNYDITHTRHEVVFAADETTATLTHATTDDVRNQGNHTVKARLNLGRYRWRADSREAEVWIKDDDVATVTMRVATDTQVEGRRDSHYHHSAHRRHHPRPADTVPLL